MRCKQCNDELAITERHYCNRCHSWLIESAPAQEEKEMQFECRCKKCYCSFMSNRNNSRLCNTCGPKLTADLRDRWDRAFYAALTGTCMNPQITNYAAAVTEASCVATETIRRHADMMAARDAVIAEVAG